MFGRSAALLVLAGCASGAIAAPITISNYSFETAVAEFQAPPDWTFVAEGSQPGVNVQNVMFMGKSGSRFVDLGIAGSNGSLPLAKSSLFSASLGTFQPLMQYTLTVSVAHTEDNNYTDTMFARYGLATSASPSSIVSSTGDSTRTDGDLVYSEFRDRTLTFTTGETDTVIGQDLRVALQFTNDGQFFHSVKFDNVRLDATPVTVPEPTSGIFVFGAMAMLWSRRRAS